MTHFYSTSDFREQIAELTHKPKNGYTSVTSDICYRLENKTIKDIRENRDMIRSEEAFSIIKLRLANSKLKLTKKDGFRLIYYVSKKDDCVVFLTIYPKRGTLGLNSISDGGMKLLLSNLISQKEKNMLMEHDIKDNLLEIAKKNNDKPIVEGVDDKETIKESLAQ